MSLFDWLLVGHLVGDFMLQTDKMAGQKAQQWRWMLRHVGCYMVSVTAGIVLYALRHPLPLWPTFVTLLFIAATHVILDRREFTAWWMRSTGISRDSVWLGIVVDQVFHVLVLAIAAEVLLIAGSAGGA